MPAEHDRQALRPNDAAAGAKSEESALPSDASLDDSEVRIRRALGLTPGSPQSWRTSQERSEPVRRAGAAGNGQGHKSRFVQDGEVPVVQMHARTGRSHGAEPPAGSQTPERARLAEAEAALRQERLAREQAERALREAQALVHDLQTRLGHAQLARDEAIASERAMVERMAQAATSPDNEAEQLAGAELDETRFERPARKPRQKRRAGEKSPPLTKSKPVKWWLPKSPTLDGEV